MAMLPIVYSMSRGQASAIPLDGEQEIAPLVAALEPLDHRYPAPAQHPPHLAAPPDPQLVGEDDAGVARHARPDERGSHEEIVFLNSEVKRCSAVGR